MDHEIGYVLSLFGVRATPRQVEALRNIHGPAALRHVLMNDGQQFYGRALYQDEAPGEVRSGWHKKREAVA